MDLNNIYLNNILNEILDVLKKYQIFTEEELVELNESITITSREYISNNIYEMIDPNFDKKFTDYIKEIYLTQISHIYNQDILYRIEYKLTEIIKSIKNKLYITYIPPRSYNNSFIRNVKMNIPYLGEKITILKEIPQPDQRTEGWYIFRHNLLTASSIWKVFKSQSTRNQLIYEKCKPYNIYINAPIDSPLHWGQKYEPVSVEFYKKLYNYGIIDSLVYL